MKQCVKVWCLCLAVVPLLLFGSVAELGAAEAPSEPAPAADLQATPALAVAAGETSSCAGVLSLASDELLPLESLKPRPCPDYCIGGAFCFTDCDCGGSSLGVCRERFGTKECLCK